LTHPPDIILIFDIVIAHNGDEPLKDRTCCLHLQVGPIYSYKVHFYFEYRDNNFLWSAENQRI